MTRPPKPNARMEQPLSTPRRASAKREAWWLPFALGIAGIVVVWAGSLAGLWWVATPTGLAIGLLVPRTGTALVVAAVVGVLGWGIPLAVQALSVPIGRTAAVVAGIMGLGSNGAIVVVVTLVVALLFAIAGAWVGSAIRRLLLLVWPMYGNP